VGRNDHDAVARIDQLTSSMIMKWKKIAFLKISTVGNHRLWQRFEFAQVFIVSSNNLAFSRHLMAFYNKCAMTF
jgi:hypothetical protein